MASRTPLSTTGGTRVDLVTHLLDSPATYAALVAAPVALVVGETVLPALVGLAFLGDHARPGWGAIGIVGFVAAVGAALVLSRFGDVSP